MLYSAAQLTYLEHLGIDIWVPKDVPAVSAGQEVPQATTDSFQTASVTLESQAYAAPSHFEDVPVAQPVADTQAAQLNPSQQMPPSQMPSPSVTPAQTSPVNVAASALNSALTSSIPAPAFPQSVQAEEAGSVSRVEFNIQFWCYSTGVWFIGGDVNVTPEQHKLVHNLAQFIQGKKRRPRHVNVFSWPMIDSPNVDQGEEIAAKYLLAHIERLQQACEQKTIIVFNDCDYFPSQIPHVKLEVNLQQLLNDPVAKKALWQQILPLKFQD